MNNYNTQYFRLLFAVLFALLATGCSTLSEYNDPDDPFERYNRSMYSFNETVDEYALKPVATLYKDITPKIVDKSISNFFSNLDDVLVVINDVLQFNFSQAVSDISRLFINSTIGIAGFIDVASGLDFKKHKEDFGQTLGVWGVQSGPYVVLPFIGPSSIRDSIGFVTDTTQFDVLTTQLEGSEEFLTLSLKYIDKRADLLKASKLLQEIAPDPYAFTRDAWTQRRNNLIHNGEAPADPDSNDIFSDDDLFKDDIIRK